jgi:hypothetical protein
MSVDKFAAFSLIAIIATVGLTMAETASPTGAAALSSMPSGHAKLPAEVLDAIKNRAEEVEIPVSKGVSRIFFIDYKGPVHAGTGTDCGPDSASYKPIRRNLKWKSFPVPYQVDASASGLDAAAAKQAVVNAFDSWDAEEHPAGAFFAESSAPKVTVGWAFIDGFGGTLAVTSISYNRFTNTILSASVTYDTGDSWAIYPGLSCSGQGGAFDVEGIGAHELGHVIGLAHASKTTDSALTMYPTAGQGETHKRTLGTGDKKGLDAIY